MMLFAILFGLSMDYEVFLLRRIREEYVRTGDNGRAVADGLATTARVITAAAAIMVFVFGVVHLRRRPASQAVRPRPRGRGAHRRHDRAHGARARHHGVARRRNWWLPKWLDRFLPKVHIEGEADLDHEIEELLESASVVEEKGAPR